MNNLNQRKDHNSSSTPTSTAECREKEYRKQAEPHTTHRNTTNTQRTRSSHSTSKAIERKRQTTQGDISRPAEHGTATAYNQRCGQHKEGGKVTHVQYSDTTAEYSQRERDTTKQKQMYNIIQSISSPNIDQPAWCATWRWQAHNRRVELAFETGFAGSSQRQACNAQAELPSGRNTPVGPLGQRMND